MFWIVFAVAVVVFILSFRFRKDHGNPPEIKIDVVAAILIGLGIVLLTLGFNNLNAWGGILEASDAAPFSIAGVSPAPVLIVLGIVLGQIFFFWTRRRTKQGKVPLVQLSVLRRPSERAAVYAMFIVVSLEAALNFTVPLYIQIVQGRTPFDTALAMVPFNLTVFFTATLVVRLYSRLSSRTIGVWGIPPHDRRTPVALARRDEQLGDLPDDPRPLRVRRRPGCARDARLQRARDGGAQRTGGRCRLDPRHDAEPRVGGRHGGRRRCS